METPVYYVVIFNGQLQVHKFEVNCGIYMNLPTPVHIKVTELYPSTSMH